jgi:hypothetical protein
VGDLEDRLFEDIQSVVGLTAHCGHSLGWSGRGCPSVEPDGKFF